MIVKAVEDAAQGDADALVWLDTTGRQWCELLRIPVDDWPAAAARLEAAQRAQPRGEGDRSEYWASYYHQNKDDPAYQERQRANKARYLAKRLPARE